MTVDSSFLGSRGQGDARPPRVDYPRAFVDIAVALVTRPPVPLPDEEQRVIRVNAQGEKSAATELTIPERTDQVHTGIVPTRATYTRRTFKQAGECDVTVHGSVLPFNPLVVMGAFLRLYVGVVDKVDAESEDAESQIRQQGNLRFVGYADQFEDSMDDKGPAVTFKCRDLSALFMDARPVPKSVVPLYSDTLGEALQKLVDYVCQPFVDAGEDAPITLRKIDSRFDAKLSSAAHARSQTAPILIDPNATVWSVLTHACGLVSTTPYVILDELVITSATQAYGTESETKYSFIFGSESSNLLSLNRVRKYSRNRRGVRLVSYSPALRQVIEAQWPQKGQEPAHTRPVTGLGNRVPPHQRHDRKTQSSTSSHSHNTGRPRSRTVTQPKDEYELLECPPGIHDRDALEAAAKAAYLERSLGDLEGRLETIDLTNDVLDIKHSDRVSIMVNPSLEAELLNTTSDRRAAKLLSTRLGMDLDTLSTLVQATRLFPLAQYFVRSSSVSYSSEGRSSATMEFIKLIDARPASQGGTGL